MLDRLISEEQLVLEKVPRSLFPPGLYQDDENRFPLPGKSPWPMWKNTGPKYSGLISPLSV